MSRLKLQVGAWAVHAGQRVRILSFQGLSSVSVRSGDGDARVVPVQELLPEEAPETVQPQTGHATDSEAARRALQEAEFRLQAIEPLLRLGEARTDEQVRARAAELNVGRSTLYRWLRTYQEAQSVHALQRRVRADLGTSRLPDRAEALMDTVIDRVYLTRERPTLRSAYERLRGDVDRANLTLAPGELALDVPAFSTFRRRVGGVERSRRLSRRLGPRAAAALKPILGEYPGATYPLAVAQIDHTPIDLILVDSVHRQPMGRAWLTLVMDVFSRVVLGFSVSFDAPSAFGTGVALSHAILPKERWLARHQGAVREISASLVAEMVPGEIMDAALMPEWPCWGRPVLVKMDNAREFRGRTLERALARHGIDREFRPVARPHYGGHVERLLGTFAREIHTLPGTTFSSVHERGDYDAEGRAVMTLDAFEVWLSAYILGIYHRRVHDGLGMTPLEAWERGLLEGTPDHPATGLPDRIMGDEETRLRLDFLPFFERTVQPAGVSFEGMTYVGPALAARVRENDPEQPRRSRLFQVSYDPRDISGVYFLDPDLDQYFELRSRQPNFPAMSIWDLRATRRYARSKRVRADDELSIMKTFQVMRRLVEGEGQATKEVRTEAEKRRRREKLGGGQLPRQPVTPPSQERPALSIFENMGDIQPFDDLKD